MSRRDIGTTLIHRCPPELLSNIFIMSLPSVPHALLDEPTKSSRTLSQVCFRWRGVALSVSRLWNHITLSRWSNSRIEWTEELSQRSRRVPVSLRVWIGGRGWEADSALFDTRLSRLLKELMPRTLALEVRLDCTLLANECAPNLMQVLRNHAVPLLEFFHLTPFNNQRNTNYSPLEFFFDGQAPKLTSLRFNIHFSSLHSSILLNVTTFCLTYGYTFIDPNFTWTRCLNLLKAMPSLENLLLTVELAPDTMDDDIVDVEEIYLSKLKHLQMHCSYQDCASLFKWIRSPPGCTFDIVSNDTEVDEWCTDLLQAVEYCIIQSEISAMGDYTLDISVCHGSIRLLVYPPSQEPIFLLSINTSHAEDEEEGEEDLLSDLYEHLFLFSGMILRSGLLARASEICLAVNVILPLEVSMAPVFGLLVRACKQAKRVVLAGSENAFILPILFDFMEDMDRMFDALFLRRELASSPSSSDSDSDSDISNFDSDCDLDLFPANKKRTTANIPSTIHFLHTDFNISTPTNKYHFMNLVIWYQSILPLVRDTFWPVQSFMHELTMRGVMDYYLKPTVDRAV